jgi:hypothetical protein
MLTAAVLLVTTACENLAGASTGTEDTTTPDTTTPDPTPTTPAPATPPTYVDSVDAFLLALKDPAIKAIEITKHIEIPINENTAIDGKTITKSAGINSVTVAVKGGKNLQIAENTTLAGILLKVENTGTVTVAEGKTLTLDNLSTLELASSAHGKLGLNAKIDVLSGGKVDDKGDKQLWEGVGGTLVVHSGGTAINNTNTTIVSPVTSGGGTFQPEAGGSFTMDKSGNYSIAGKVNLKADFSLASTMNFTVPSGAELVAIKKFELAAHTLVNMTVESGGVITLGANGDLALADGAKMALNGEVRVENGGKITGKDFTQVWSNNASGSILIKSGGQGTMDSKLLVGSSSDSNVFMALDANSSLKLTKSEFLITGKLTIVQVCVVSDSINIRIAENSNLTVNSNITLFIKNTQPSLFGDAATSSITLVSPGGDIKVTPSETSWKSPGTYYWVPATQQWYP